MKLFLKLATVIGLAIIGSQAMQHTLMLDAVGILETGLVLGFLIQIHQFAVKGSLMFGT